MNSKKYKSTIAIIATLTALSGGMFAYNNIYLPKLQASQTETEYVAKEDIKAYTELKPEMFESIQVPKGAVLNGYIKDINTIKGFKLKGNLLKGEALSSVRLTKEDLDKQGGLIVTLSSDATNDVKGGDYVNVYVLLTDKATKQNSVKLLFENKKVTDTEVGLKKEISTVTQEKKSLTISFTENELKDYYVAKETGKIIVAKVGDLDTKVSSKDGEIQTKESENSSGSEVGKFDANSSEVKNAQKVQTKDGKSMSVVLYEVKEGDTLASLSLKFKTTEDIVKELNDGKETFKAGDRITVPAI